MDENGLALEGFTFGDFYSKYGSVGVNEHSLVSKMPLRQLLDRGMVWEEVVSRIGEDYGRGVFGGVAYANLLSGSRDIYEGGINLMRKGLLLKGKSFVDDADFFSNDSLNSRVDVLGGDFPLGLALKYFMVFTFDCLNSGMGASHSCRDTIENVVGLEYRFMGRIAETMKS